MAGGSYGSSSPITHLLQKRKILPPRLTQRPSSFLRARPQPTRPRSTAWDTFSAPLFTGTKGSTRLAANARKATWTFFAAVSLHTHAVRAQRFVNCGFNVSFTSLLNDARTSVVPTSPCFVRQPSEKLRHLPLRWAACRPAGLPSDPPRRKIPTMTAVATTTAR